MIIILSALPLFAFDTAGFSPFVTRLEAEVIDDLVRLAWVDSPDARGPVYIYRSLEPFGDPKTLDGLSPVEVPYGSGTYTDETGAFGILHYFAAASDENGLLYNFPIISNNTISVLAAEKPLSILSEIFRFSFETEPDPKIAVFTETALEEEAVPETVIFAEAVLEEETVPETATVIEALVFTETSLEEEAIPVTAVPETAVVIEAGFAAELYLKPESQSLKHPRVFVRDIETAEGSESDGEDYFLAAIVRNNFAERDWEAAREDLLLFLSKPRSPETFDRAKFYLGQCYYFLDQPRNGIYEFLVIQNKYPAEVAEWIQASLLRITF